MTAADDALERSLPVGPARPLRLDAPGQAWLVLEGALDVEAVRLDAEGHHGGAGRFLFRLPAEAAAFGIAALPLAGGGSLTLIARATDGTRVGVLEMADQRAVAQLDRWVTLLGGLLGAAGAAIDLLARPDLALTAPRGKRVGGMAGAVSWLDVEGGEMRLLGDASFTARPGDPPLALCFGHSWAVAAQASRLAVLPTEALRRRGDLTGALERFAAAALTALAARWAEEDATLAERLRRRREGGELVFQAGLDALAGVLERRRRRVIRLDARDDPLHSALRLVAERAGVRLARSAPIPDGTIVERIEAALRQARVASRRLLLSAGWERRDGGPMLGLARATQAEQPRPVALLPTRGGYDAVDPASGQRVPVRGETLTTLLADAWVLQRALPDQSVSLSAMLRFGLVGGQRDLWRVLLAGLAGALLSLVLPMVTAPLFGDVLPRADLASFAAILLAMAVGVLGNVAFQLVRGFASLRLEGRMEADVQAAVWDRLLRLPTGFFRQFSTGDLTDRVMNISAIREVLSSTVTGTVLDAAFSLTSFGLLFWYSWKLALIATGMAVLAVGITALLSALQIPHQRAAMQRMGRLSGLTLQILMGAAKLRAAAAESRLFARWSRLYAEQKRDLYAARLIGAVQNVFSQVFSTLTTIAIFAAVIWFGQAGPNDSNVPLLDVGTFMAFNSALGQFMGTLMSLVGAGAMLVTIVPMCARIRPILDAVPEAADSAEIPGRLSGDIEFQSVNFRYAPDGPKVLDNVSFRVSPGQHVAVVGPSGSGKSTLVRLMLGFERPEAGVVLFDGRDLGTLDLKAVRRQAGVVLQQAALMPGSVFENIIGSSALTMDDAWEAARLAGFDEEIRAMPMGMQTMLTDAANTLSGGQRQRLLIARALVRRPRIVIFDEATSALDNRTQAIVNASLANLNATRIVVAHRLTTVRNADRILVMENGRIVEDGGFDALIDVDGLFARLARRQQA